MTEPLVAASGINFAYGERQILRDIELSVYPGDVVGLLGPNGTGKSTLVGILCGDLDTHSGSVLLSGKPIADYSRRELALQRAVMPQANDFPFSYLVHDIVAMGRASHPHNPEYDEKVIDQAMIQTGIEHLADRDVTTLSGGEKARVTLARVIAQDASVVLLDEPTAALDISHQQQTMQLCGQMAQAGKAVIAVMHDIQLSASRCTMIALMSHGKIIDYGPPEQVITSDALTQVYQWPIKVEHMSDGRLAILPQVS